MSEVQRAARNYLTPPPSTFWRWRESGQVITWVDGRTIAFRAELEQVLRRLARPAGAAEEGLPPLGSVVLLLAATRAGWSEGAGPSLLSGLLSRAGGQNWKAGLVQVVREGLERVTGLEATLRSIPAARTELSAFVFEGSSPRTSGAVAAEVVRLLDQGLPENVFDPVEQTTHWETPTVFWYELRCLHHGLSRFDPNALALRQQTGLEELPQPAEIELPAAERVRSLIARLEEEDAELSGLARLARDLMAAVTLPRSVSDRDDLPLGGVSDISNRGPLDRLLLSELAHDDLTLAVRVATGEALYLRREQPPRTPPRHRVLLLDAGLRSWGIPRVFATAVALAVAATAGREGRLSCFRARGRTVVPVDLTSRDGLVEHLASLEPDLHPGPALAALQAALEASPTGVSGLPESPGPPEGLDVVVVTTEDVATDLDFQRALVDQALWPLHLATVRRDGRFQLLLCGLHGRKTLRTAMLDLEGLFTPRKSRAAPLIDRKQPAGLPAILSVRPFPLLLSHAFNPSQSWLVPGQGLLTLTRDRRLLLWTGPGQGARQLADDLPRGNLVWASAECRDGEVKAVTWFPGTDALHLLTIRPTEGRCEVVKLERSVGRGGTVAAHNGALFLISGSQADIFSLATGKRGRVTSIPRGFHWDGGRFFRAGNEHWMALCNAGPTARLEAVLSAPRPLIRMFERPGIEGPIGVTPQGDLYFTATGETRKTRTSLVSPVQVRAISRSGDRVVIGNQPGTRQAHHDFVIEVDTGEVRSWYGDPDACVERTYHHACPLSLRTQFTHIGPGPRGQLVLTTRKKAHLGIEGSGNEIRLRSLELQSRDFTRRVAFQPTPSPAGVGYTLKVASWSDGSQAFLDSRGLLHLRSSSFAIRETTIVLTDWPLAGWCSDGRLWGHRYFTGPPPDTSDPAFPLAAINAFARRLS
jgi:MoxR-vWA-beta-propeller ternary system domain bpX1/MoxR-vWA-beta-propeller ternary system domain bpX0